MNNPFTTGNHKLTRKQFVKGETWHKTYIKYDCFAEKESGFEYNMDFMPIIGSILLKHGFIFKDFTHRGAYMRSPIGLYFKHPNYPQFDLCIYCDDTFNFDEELANGTYNFINRENHFTTKSLIAFLQTTPLKSVFRKSKIAKLVL